MRMKRMVILIFALILAISLALVTGCQQKPAEVPKPAEAPKTAETPAPAEKKTEEKTAPAPAENKAEQKPAKKSSGY